MTTLTKRDRKMLDRLKERAEILRHRIKGGLRNTTELKAELHALEWAIGKLSAADFKGLPEVEGGKAKFLPFNAEEKPLPNPATFSVPPKRGEKRVSRRLKGKHLYWNVSSSVIAAMGAVVFVARRNECFGGEKSREFRSKVMIDPTWGQVFAAFKESIPVTGDYHHCFLEGIHKMPIHKAAVVIGPTFYEFTTGS